MSQDTKIGKRNVPKNVCDHPLDYRIKTAIRGPGEHIEECTKCGAEWGPENERLDEVENTTVDRVMDIDFVDGLVTRENHNYDCAVTTTISMFRDDVERARFEETGATVKAVRASFQSNIVVYFNVDTEEE